MPTDTSERGIERLICVALTGAPCDPAAPGMAAEREAPFGGAGYVCGNPADYDREYCVDLAQFKVFLQTTQPKVAAWDDTDRVRRLVTEEIPAKVSADPAYVNARRNSDRQNARIEHDRALARVMKAILKDDTPLFKQFSDNEGFKRQLADTVFGMTYPPPG